MPLPPPPPPNQLLHDLENLIHQAIPLVEATYVMSQVVGNILKATNSSSDPPATYYISEPNDPSAPTPPAPPGAPPALVNVASITLDSAGGLIVDGPNYGVTLGAGGQPVAVVGLSNVNGTPVITGNGKVLVGPGSLPLGAIGSLTGWGPIEDGAPDDVFVSPDDLPRDPSRHTLYTVSGSAATWDQGYPALCGQDGRVQQYFLWQPVNYPANPAPEGDSVAAGVKELVRLISGKSGTFGLVGYSQGAVVTCQVWRDHILNPQGDLHDRLDDFFAHVTFGNPMRCPGYANGNGLAGKAPPANLDNYVTGGIAGPDDLTPWQTMPWHMDFAHDGDLYASCPTGPDPWHKEAPPGQMETAIYNMVMEKMTGPDGILEVIGEMLTDPIEEIIPLIEALINGIQFLSVNLEPHNNYYDVLDTAQKYLASIGGMTPVR